MKWQSEIPAADAAALLLLGLLAAGWIFAADADAADAIVLAAITALLFWAPLRMMDYLRHGRLRGNFIMVFLRLEPSARGRKRLVAAPGDA